MPVTVEAVDQLSDQDRSDLIKIYQDAPSWMLDDKSPEQWLQDQLSGQGVQVLAGRFNDRLLGALTLANQEGGTEVANLCVRKVTRRRGVASRLIAYALEHGARPLVAKVPQNSTTDMLFQKFAFEKVASADGQAEWQLN